VITDEDRTRLDIELISKGECDHLSLLG
jgi:hypothetical protein